MNLSSHLISLSLLATVSDAARDSLERRSAFWFICLLISSAGVALGCILEIGETWSDFRKWLAARKDPEAPEEDKSWHKPLAAIGLLLVILGVVGEGIAEAFTSIAETAVRAHDEQVLGETIIQAGNAKDSAEAAKKDAELAKGASGEAVLKAGTASDASTKALREADTFEVGIVSAKKQAADAESHLADALSRAAKAEKDLDEYKEKMRGRYISEEQKNKFLKLVKGQAHGETVNIHCLKWHLESLSYANDLRKLLQAAGWKVPEVEEVNTVEMSGINVVITSVVPVIQASGMVGLDPRSKALYGGVIANALAQVNVINQNTDVMAQTDQYGFVTGDNVLIFVGAKP